MNCLTVPGATSSSAPALVATASFGATGAPAAAAYTAFLVGQSTVVALVAASGVGCGASVTVSSATGPTTAITALSCLTLSSLCC